MGGVSVEPPDDLGARSDRKTKGRDRGDGGTHAKPSTSSTLVQPPGLIHGFQAARDSARAASRLIREEAAATRPETPRARKARLEDEAREEQRQLDADAVERARRQQEEDESLRRQLAIKREDEEQRRLAEEAAAERKERSEEAAAGRRELREEAKEERRIARSNRPPDPPPQPKPIVEPTRVIPQITRDILVNDEYKCWSVWIIAGFKVLRTGSETERAAKKVEFGHMRDLLRNMRDSRDRTQVNVSDHLGDLIRDLEKGVDLARPSFFNSYYQTGADYTD